MKVSNKQTLKEKTAKGLFWGGLSNGVQQLLNLVFGIFLARLLSPEDYGMVGMLSIFSLIASSLQESGFTAALANKKEIKHEDYNAVFWFSILISLSLYTILFFCAPLIARFFNTPELTQLARYSFLGFVIASIGTAQNAYLFRSLMVKQRSQALIIGLFISGIVGITLAFNGYSYWGIATQSLVYVSVVTICCWFYSPWRPSFHIDLKPLKPLIPFSCKLLITNIFSHISGNLFAVILGKYYTEKEVGYYNQANKWSYMGHSLISGMVGGVAQPVLSQVTDERDRQVRIFRKMLRFTAFVSFPAMFGLSLIAPELITIAITDKWLESARILQLLCISGAFIPIITLYSNLIISKGKSDVYMWSTIVLSIVLLIVMCMLHSLGIYTMVITYVCINIAWFLVWHYFVWKEIRLGLFAALKDILPFLFIAALVMGITYYATSYIGNIYLLFVGKIVIAASLYIFIMWVSRSVTFKESVQYLLKR